MTQLAFSPSSDPKPLAIVVGAGASGCAVTKLLHSQGYRVRLLDTKTIADDMLEWTQAHKVETIIAPHAALHFEGCDLVVPSPGVAVSSLKPFLPHANELCMAETEFAWRVLQAQNQGQTLGQILSSTVPKNSLENSTEKPVKPETIIAITGTSGKTTTTSLISAMLEAHGLRVFTGGNIGTPLSSYVLDLQKSPADKAAKADVLVLELSSFQLQNCSTFRPDIAILLNISENHLDYHASMDEYIDAKMQLFAHQGPEDVIIVQQSLKPLFDAKSFKAKIQYFGQAPYDGSRFTDMRLMGEHNALNAEVAALACSVLHLPFETAKAIATDFLPIAHRLEHVDERNGVLYINDSKATTIEALHVALRACKAPILLLAGGVFKGGDLTSLVPLLQEKVKGVALFGGSREIFEKAWKEHIPVSWDASLEAAVCRQQKMSAHGDTILLAPATSSYDQYNNYMRRGEDFKRIVKEILP